MDKKKVIVIFFCTIFWIYAKCSQYSFFLPDTKSSDISSLLLNTKAKVSLLPNDSVDNECFFIESKEFIKTLNKDIAKVKDVQKRIHVLIEFSELKFLISKKLYWNPREKKVRQKIIGEILYSIEKDLNDFDEHLYSLSIHDQKRLIQDLEKYEGFKIELNKRMLKLWDNIDWFRTIGCDVPNYHNSLLADAMNREPPKLVRSRNNYIKLGIVAENILKIINERIIYHCGSIDGCNF